MFSMGKKQSEKYAHSAKERKSFSARLHVAKKDSRQGSPGSGANGLGKQGTEQGYLTPSRRPLSTCPVRLQLPWTSGAHVSPTPPLSK